MTFPYSNPVAQLLQLGDDRTDLHEPWLDYKQLGLTADHIPALIQLASDRELLQLEEDTSAAWAPLHAWRSLGQLQATAAVVPLLDLAESEEAWSDWLLVDLPLIFQLIGLPAIPALAKRLQQAQAFETYCVAVEGLEAIAKNSEARSRCIEALAGGLKQFDRNHPDVNGLLVGSLAALQAVEMAPLIEQAFAANRVDDAIAGDWEEVQVTLGLKSAEALPERRFANGTNLLEQIDQLVRSESSPEFVE
jgi:hypothetical protein